MKLKCKCGHDLPVRSVDGSARIRCLYCGCEYTLSRGPEGEFGLKLMGAAQSDANGGAATAEWPDDLALELEGPVVEKPAHRQAAQARPPLPGSGKPGAQAAEVPMQDRRSWFYYLGDAWAYPFRGDAKWTLLLWLFLNVFIVPFVAFVPLLGMFFPFLMLGLLVLYEFTLIRQSAYGAEALPSLPNSDDPYQLVVRPIGQLLAVLIGSGLPYFLTLLPGVLFYMPPWWPEVRTAGLLISGLMLPMNMLAVATADNAAAVNPRFTFPAVMRVPFAYVLCAGFCALCLIAGWAAFTTVARAAGGSFTATLLGEAVFLYLITVAARALGTLHYAHADKMGWLK